MRPYTLAPHVRACVSEYGAVFLDLEHDAYFGFDADQARLLCMVVDGLAPLVEEGGQAEFPACSSAGDDVLSRRPGEGDTSEASELAQSLRERALLVPTESAGPALPQHVYFPDAELLPWDRMDWRAIRATHVVVFLRALLTAAFLIKFRPFPSIVARIGLRKAMANQINTAAAFDAEVAGRLLAAYVHIRLFFYSPKGRCLFDSLTLLEYLAHYELYPDWIVGVQINPFASHSWLQYKGFVLNGTPHYVRAYSAILVT